MYKSKIEYDVKNSEISQIGFDPETVGKTEAIFNIGNGYLGQRAANDEASYKDTRNTFINGTFNKAINDEVTELPNIADTTRMDFIIDGEKVTLQKNNFDNYKKSLSLKSLEVLREFTYKTNSKKKIIFKFRRFASFKNVNNILHDIEIQEKDGKKFDIKITNFIDGQLTNSGAMHFNDGEKRIYNNETMEMLQTTTESNILIPIRVTIKGSINGKKIKKTDNEIGLDRRQISITTKAKDAKIIKMNKYVTLTSSIDDSESLNLNELTSNKSKEKARKNNENIHNDLIKNGYKNELKDSNVEYKNVILSKGKISIKSENGFDDLAIKFARYHLSVFTPRNDFRLGIGAKGLSGEGYKGHSFWDTEMFITPVYNMIDPSQAKKLIEYRYLGLAGARKKAMANKLKGAMYPWEAAWPTDGEVTPVWGGIDIISGKATKIWSGFIEYHIIADIAYSLYQYYIMSGDENFMNTMGYEMLIDTAILWTNMAKLNKKGSYDLLNVIGPNEYKEHVDNNSFTNYMAKWNIDLALSYLMSNNKKIKKVSDKLKITKSFIQKMQKVSKKLVLNKPNKDGIIGENDTFLSLPKVPNMEKYKKQKHVGSMFKDYNQDQVNKMQVCKQADLLLLMLIQEDLFSKDIKEKNFYYYESITTHDSSLSLSSHAILAADLKLPLAYELFKKSSKIDLGENMKTSDHGIHAASLGGMIQIAMNGFGGLRVIGNNLRIEPNLPKQWKQLKYEFIFKGQKLGVNITKTKLMIKNFGNRSIEFINNDKIVKVPKGKEINLNY